MQEIKLAYNEGTWFAVPLRSSGYAIGVVARMSGDGRTFGYFFGPKRTSIPRENEISYLTPHDAIWAGKFGDLGIIQGIWKIISRDISWNRDDWPLPPFIRVDEIEKKAWKAIYSDDLNLVSNEPCDPDLVSKYPKDALSGYGAVEIRLTNLLDKINTKGFES